MKGEESTIRGETTAGCGKEGCKGSGRRAMWTTWRRRCQTHGKAMTRTYKQWAWTLSSIATYHVKYSNINDNNKNNDKNNTNKKRLNKWVSQMWQEEISTKGRSREIMGREIRVMRIQLKDEGQTRRENRARFSGLAVANISRWTEVRRCWWWWALKGSWVERGDEEGGDEWKVVIDKGGDRQRWWKTKVMR